MNLKVSIKDEFPVSNNLIYLNHAGVGVWPKRTAQSVQSFADENCQFGASQYPKWLQVELKLRHQCARLINAASHHDIALLKNTSEGLSIVAHGLPWSKGDNIVICNQEFPSNRIVWESLNEHGVEIRQADLSSEHTPEESIFALTDKNTKLISISSVQYASGLRMDLATIGNYCKTHGILYCIDAIQSIGALEFDVQKFSADFVVADGHKWMLGPEGVALFYCNPEIADKLKLYQYGWHMVEAYDDFDKKDWSVAKNYRRFECGSPNMLGIHALCASLSLLEEVTIAAIENRILSNASFLIQRLANKDNIELISSTVKGRYAGIVNFRIHDCDVNSLFNKIISHGSIVCAVRSGGIRWSPHFYNTHDELDKALGILFELIETTRTITKG